MKPILIVALLVLCFSACTVPTANDFESLTRPLSQDEFIVIWRFPHQSHLQYTESLDTTQAYANELRQEADPLFQQLIPRIFSDAKYGRLTIREEDEISNLDEQPIADVAGKMKTFFGANWQNIEPFMSVFHLTQRRKVSDKGFLADDLELMIIGQDPEGHLPEKYFGSVLVSDLVELGYTIEAGDKSYELRNYLEKIHSFAYPIHYKSLDMANGLTTLEQAFETKQRVLQGKWAEIEWLEGEPNLSGQRMRPITAEALQANVGFYAVVPDQGSYLSQGTEPIQVEIVIEGNHLSAVWSNQGPYHMYRMFPTAEDSFFTVHGDMIRFDTQSDGSQQFTITDKQQIQTIGTKKQ